MANGSQDARRRRNIVSRKSTSRRLLILGCIAAVGLPGTSFVSAQSPLPATQVPGSPAAIAQAIASGGQQSSGDIAQTAGVLDRLLGGQSAPPKASKEKDDGRKAYPLPPPDPSSVNWNGIPFHRPQAGQATSSADQPIRDVQPSGSGDRARSSDPRSSRTSSSGASSGNLNPALPRPPQLGATQATTAPAASPAARVASLAPLPAAKMPSTPTAGILSSNSSSRRSGRRPIDPLSTDELLPAVTGGSAPETGFQNVARRELQPAELPASAVTGSGASGISASATTARPAAQANVPLPIAAQAAPAPVGSTPVATPPSLAAIDATMASQRRTVRQRTASRSSQVEGSLQVEASLSDNSASLPSIPAETATAPNLQAATPSVPATAPSLRNGDGALREDHALEAQLRPLRQLHEETPASSQVETRSSEIIGSGIANSTSPPTSAPPSSVPATSDPLPAALPLESFTGSATGRVDSKSTPDAQLPDAGEPAELVARGDVTPRSIGSAETDANAAVTRSKQLAASELPGIQIVTEGPSEILIRELTQYEVRVENRGTIDAPGVIVRTTLPPWAEVKGHNASGGVVEPVLNEATGHLEWTIASLPAGVVERLFVRVTPIRSGSFDVATSWTTMPVTHTAQVTVREPKLAIEIDGPNEIIYGQSQKYRVRVLNPGDAIASNVLFTLVPEVGDSVKQSIGNIPAGKEASFEIELTARELERLKINGTATADLDLSAVAKKSVVVAAATIEATLSGPPLKFQNSEAAYQLLLVNTGRALSDAVIGEVHLPPGVTYVGGIEGARMEGDRLTWTIGAMPPGESKEFNFTCKLEQTGNHAIAFHCAGSAAGRASVEIDTAVQAIADLKLLVIDPPAPAAVGADVVYEVVINNRGSKAAEDVRIVAQFGNGIEPVRIEGHTGDLITGQVLFKPIARIEAGDELKLKVIARADRPGDHRFRAEVRSGETVLVAEEATMFMEIRSERISRSSSDAASR